MRSPRPRLRPRLGGHIMDNELRAALRRFVSAEMGEEKIEKLMKEPDERIDAWDDSRRLPAGPKTREEVLDYLAGLDGGLTQFFKEYHAEHGATQNRPNGKRRDARDSIWD